MAKSLHLSCTEHDVKRRNSNSISMVLPSSGTCASGHHAFQLETGAGCLLAHVTAPAFSSALLRPPATSLEMLPQPPECLSALAAT